MDVFSKRIKKFWNDFTYRGNGTTWIDTVPRVKLATKKFHPPHPRVAYQNDQRRKFYYRCTTFFFNLRPLYCLKNGLKAIFMKKIKVG